MPRILDGNRVRDDITSELKPRVDALAARGRPPGLAVVLVGHNPDSVRQAYLDLNHALGLGSGGVSAPPDADREGFDPEESYQAGNEEGANFAESSVGGILGVLGQLS